MLGTDLGAVFLVDLASFDGFVATVTAIVSTAFIVVTIVAIAISYVLDRSTGVLGRLAKIFGVDAFALQASQPTVVINM